MHVAPQADLQDGLLDVIILAEEHPDAAAAVPDLKERVARLGAAILTI